LLALKDIEMDYKNTIPLWGFGLLLKNFEIFFKIKNFLYPEQT